MNFKKILCKFKPKRWKATILASIGCACGLSSSIASGVFARETFYEKFADYTANVVEKQTKNQTYCSLSVEKTIDSGNLPRPYYELHNLFGIFKQTVATYGSFFNLYKTDEVYCDSLLPGFNYSIFYSEIGGVQPYAGRSNEYKHAYFPFEFMFSQQSGVPIKTRIYISKSQADLYLNNHHMTPGNYSEVLKKDIVFLINGKSVTFTIANIYKETNYYYDCMKEIAGDFFIFDYYDFPVPISRQNVYLLTKHPYKNQYMMEYIIKTYPDAKFNVSVNKHNIIGEIEDLRITGFYYDKCNDNLTWLPYIFIAVSLIFISFSFFLKS